MSKAVTALSVHDIAIPGSDHKGFVADLAVRPDACSDGHLRPVAARSRQRRHHLGGQPILGLTGLGVEPGRPARAHHDEAVDAEAASSVRRARTVAARPDDGEAVDEAGVSVLAWAEPAWV